MGDIFDQIAAQVYAEPSPTPQGDIYDQIAAQVYAAPQAPEQFGPLDVLGQIGQGISFGTLDKIEGGMYGAANSIGNLFGVGNGRGFSENYTAMRDASEKGTDLYEQQNPWSSLGLQALGGAIPALVTGGSSLLARGGATAVEAAPGVLGALGRNVLGVGFKSGSAPTIMQLAKMGATQGSLYGAGNADEGQRLKGAAVGGGVGMVAAPIIGKALEKALSSAGNWLAERGAFSKGPSLAAERGSFSMKPSGTTYSPEELFLARQLKNTPTERVVQGATELSTAASDDIPLFLPEAVGSAKVDRNARFIANYEPSMEFSQAQIAGRTAGAEGRATELFSAISPEGDAFKGANKLTGGARGIIDSAEKAREDLVKPLYGAAYQEAPTITDPALAGLLEKDATLRSAISNVQKTANNADLPPNSTQLLVKARQEIGNQIDSAITQGYGRKARDLTDTYNRLNDILHKNEGLKMADEAYAAASDNISALTDTFLKNLAGLTEDKVKNVGQIFNLPAERIKTLRSSFETAGKLDEWNAGIRAHLQNVVEGSREGQNFTHKITGNTIQKAKLKAATGQAYERIAKGLSYEDRFAVGKNKYNAGSTTYGNTAEEGAFEKGAGIIEKIGKGDYLQALKSIFVDADLPEELAQNMARIYFDTAKGSESLNKIIPLLKQYGQIKSGAGGAGRIVGGAQARATSVASSDRSQAPRSLSGSASQPQTQQQPKIIPQSYNNLRPNPPATQAPSANSAQPVAFIKQLPPLIQAVIKVESNGNPQAKSGAGAMGLMQLMPENVKTFGVSDPFHPVENVKAGMKLLSEELERFDDLKLALAAYNAGSPKVNRAIKAANSRDWAKVQKYLPQETREYISKVLRAQNEIETTLV